VVGQRIDLLIPKIATHETITQALYRLAASTGDTAIDLASRESSGQRKDGEFFFRRRSLSAKRDCHDAKCLYCACVTSRTAASQNRRCERARRVIAFS